MSFIFCLVELSETKIEALLDFYLWKSEFNNFLATIVTCEPSKEQLKRWCNRVAKSKLDSLDSLDRMACLGLAASVHRHVSVHDLVITDHNRKAFRHVKAVAVALQKVSEKESPIEGVLSADKSTYKFVHVDGSVSTVDLE